MTDRVRSLTVVLDRDYREDDVEVVVSAIRMIKGVHGVSATDHIVEMRDYMARSSLAADLEIALHDTITEFFKQKKMNR